MASAGRVQTLLTCAKAQERRAMLPDRFSVGYFWLGTRLPFSVLKATESWAGPGNGARLVCNVDSVAMCHAIRGRGTGL